MNLPPPHPAPTARQRRWAIVRLLLGTTQIVGATASLMLLLQTGVNAWSLSVVVVTCVCTTASVLLFGDRSRLGRGQSTMAAEKPASQKTQGGNR